MIRLVRVAALLIAGPLSAMIPGVGHAARQAPGVCDGRWQSYQMANDIAPFCANLRQGTSDFREQRLSEALASYEWAGQAALGIRDPADRALALDEARGGKALVLAAKGDVGGAIALLGRPRLAPQDTLALLRGYLYARQGLLAEAADALAVARRDLATSWCSGHQRALERLQRGEAVEAGDDGKRDLSDGHYLPSYLPMGCGEKDVMLATLPLGRSYRIYFESGSHAWNDTAENRAALAEMARTARNYGQRDGMHIRFRVVGHADEACRTGRSGKEECLADNDDGAFIVPLFFKYLETLRVDPWRRGGMALLCVR